MRIASEGWPFVAVLAAAACVLAWAAGPWLALPWVGLLLIPSASAPPIRTRCSVQPTGGSSAPPTERSRSS